MQTLSENIKFICMCFRNMYKKRAIDKFLRLVSQYVQIVTNGVFCEVLAYNVTVSVRRST